MGAVGLFLEKEEVRGGRKKRGSAPPCKLSESRHAAWRDKKGYFLQF
jgi:hypothetical protein